MHREATVSLGRVCDNACVFCAQEGMAREAASEEVAAHLTEFFDGA